MGTRLGYLLGTTLLLAGCGGDSGSSAVVVPAPTGTPTPTPTSPAPTPSPTGSTGEIKPTATSRSIDSVQFLTVDSATKRTSSRSVDAPGTPFSIAYDASARRYTVQNDQFTRVFGPAQFGQETSVPDLFPRVEYSLRTASDEDFLVIFKAPNASPAIPLSHAAYGAWQHSIFQASSTRIRLDYFTYGTPTPAASVPQTGTATYRWAGTANYAEDRQLFFAQASGTMVVDFAAKTVSVTVVLSGTDFFGGNFGGLTSFQANGPISGNSLGGLLVFETIGFGGSFQGQFYGPNAEEMGIVFSGAGDSASLNGAIVGTRL